MANKKMSAPAPQTEALTAMSSENRAHEAEQTTRAATHLAKIEEIYGDGDTYNAERSVAKVQAHLGSSAEHFLRAGRELIRLKEHEQPGEFLKILELRLGIAPRAAQKMMQAASKFLTSDGKVRPLLADANAGSTKVIELLTLDDVDIDALEAGERVAGIVHDDISNMSVTELRKALKAARDASLADAELVTKKEERITKLERDLSKAKRGGVTFDEHAYSETLDEARTLATTAIEGAEKSLAVLRDAVDAVLDVKVPAHLEPIAKRAAVMSIYEGTLRLAELLARVVEHEELAFESFIDDGKAQLSTLNTDQA